MNELGIDIEVLLELIEDIFEIDDPHFLTEIDGHTSTDYRFISEIEFDSDERVRRAELLYSNYNKLNLVDLISVKNEINHRIELNEKHFYRTIEVMKSNVTVWAFSLLKEIDLESEDDWKNFLSTINKLLSSFSFALMNGNTRICKERFQSIKSYTNSKYNTPYLVELISQDFESAVNIIQTSFKLMLHSIVLTGIITDELEDSGIQLSERVKKEQKKDSYGFHKQNSEWIKKTFYELEAPGKSQRSVLKEVRDLYKKEFNGMKISTSQIRRLAEIQ